MGTVSVSLPTDGSTADAADIGTPLNVIVGEFNGNIDNANIKAGAAIATSKLAIDGGIVKGMLGTDSSYAWQSWTPTITNLTVGNGTLTAVYEQTGKTVRGFIKFVLGSTSIVGSQPTFSLPVVAHARYTSSFNTPVGACWAEDAGISNYQGFVILAVLGTVLSPGVFATGATYSTWNQYAATVPFTWGANDYFSFQFEYEAA